MTSLCSAASLFPNSECTRTHLLIEMHCWVHATFTQERPNSNRRKSRNHCLIPFKIFLTSFVSSSCGHLVSQKNLPGFGIQFQRSDVSMLSENHSGGPTSNSTSRFRCDFLEHQVPPVETSKTTTPRRELIIPPLRSRNSIPQRHDRPFREPTISILRTVSHTLCRNPGTFSLLTFSKSKHTDDYMYTSLRHELRAPNYLPTESTERVWEKEFEKIDCLPPFLFSSSNMSLVQSIFHVVRTSSVEHEFFSFVWNLDATYQFW